MSGPASSPIIRRFVRKLTVMRWRPRRAIVALATVALVACRHEQRAPGIGDRAPSLSLTPLGGDSVSLARLRGRPVLVNIWATWCGPCRDEIPYLEQVYTAYHARGLELAGVSIDFAGQEPAVKDFAKELGMTYPIWLD